MKIAIAKKNTTVGDFEKKGKKIEEFCKKAKKKNCNLVIFPQFAISGFDPCDLFERDDFIKTNSKYLNKIKKKIKGIAVFCGTVIKKNNVLYNSAQLFENGKTLFEMNENKETFIFKSLKFGVVTNNNFLDEINVDILINPSSYAYNKGNIKTKHSIFSNIAKKTDTVIIIANQTGGNDSLIFEGASAVFNKRGKRVALCKDFEEDIIVYDTEKESGDVHQISKNNEEANFKALVLGTKDYIQKCGLKKYAIALSGGIDSAVTCAIAVYAVGKENVSAVFMPSKYTSKDNFEDTKKLSDNLDIKLETVLIDNIVESFTKTKIFENAEKHSLIMQNIQARVRGNIIMSLANRENSLVLNTGNKSEAAVGYCTLYGDTCGALSVISDLYKKEVYKISNFINSKKEIIPQRIIDKEPSAELKPNQKDNDDLPDYPTLDEILYLYIEKNKGIKEIVKKGFDEKIVKDIIKRMRRSEHKRKQAPLGLSLSLYSWNFLNYPITTKYIK